MHGTWARGSRWPALELAVADATAGCGPIAIHYFEWSGRNSAGSRARAADALRRTLLRHREHSPDARHILIAHSHGANIVLHALGDVTDVLGSALSGIVLLSPPLLDCAVVGEPVAAANRLLLGAVATLPLLVWASAWARAALGISQIAQLALLLLVTAGWLLLFRPDTVRGRAELLARDLSLPRINFHGLIVRAPLDEAWFALASVSAFAHAARDIWSRVLDVRTPFRRDDARRVDEARGARQLARAVFEALVLVPLSITFVEQLHHAGAEGRWATAALFLPLALVFLTAAVVIVGGALLLLLLLPAFSFLLWPFGILPTPAAALLTVSVVRAPASGWRVIDLTTPAFGWRHSVHHHPAALVCVHDYLRGALAPAGVPDGPARPR